MGKRIFIIVCIYLGAFCLHAQQITVLFQPGINGNTVAGLSKIQFLNSYPTAQNGNVLAVVKQNGQEILRMITPAFNLVNGTSFLPATAFQNASFLYSNAAAGSLVRQTGNFPDGEYEYCFTFQGSKYNNSSDEACFPNTIQNSTPLYLTNPLDGDQICDKRPTFSWQPPIPLPIGTRFKIQLVTLDKKENPAAAILKKTPVFQQDNLNQTIVPFPNNIPELQEGKRYAWQVIAYSPQSVVRSEIWEFLVQCNDAITDSAYFSYRELKPVETGDYYLAEEVLRIYFNNPYNAAPLQYQIVNVDKPNQKIKGLPNLQMKQGMNYFSIPLLGNRFFKEGNQYRLQVILASGQSLTLTFNYQSAKS